MCSNLTVYLSKIYRHINSEKLLKALSRWEISGRNLSLEMRYIELAEMKRDPGDPGAQRGVSHIHHLQKKEDREEQEREGEKMAE